MWLLVVEVLKMRFKWALAFFVGGGVMGYALNPEGVDVLGSMIPYVALACVAVLGFFGLLVDEREKRNALYRVLPLSTQQVALAKIAIPATLITLFLPLALVALAILNWQVNLATGMIALLGIHSFTLMSLQFLLFWEEFKVYINDHWFGRVICWTFPVVFGSVVGFVASSWTFHVQSPAITIVFYVAFVMLSGLTYMLFSLRKDHTY